MRVGSALINRFVRSTSSHHRPWQIAIAITAGVLIGILPKLSLLFVLVGLVCFVLPSHLPLLTLTAILSSFATPLLESTLGRVGLWSLTHPQLSAFWLRLDALPLLPWLGLHNTIVNGSLLVWGLVSLPIYLSCRVLSGIVMDDVPNDEITRVLVSSESSPRATDVDPSQEIRPLVGSLEPSVRSRPTEPPIVIWDDINHDQNAELVARYERSYLDLAAESDSVSDVASVTSDAVIRRAAAMAVWTEELITEELLMDDRTGDSDRETSRETAEESANASVDDEERWLIETTMEVVRIAERAVTNQAAMKSRRPGESHDGARTDSSTQENSEIQTGNATQTTVLNFQPISIAPQGSSKVVSDEAQLSDASIRREQMPHSSRRSHLENTRAGVAGGNASGAHNPPREEALHYLLRHLKDIQEKAQRQ